MDPTSSNIDQGFSQHMAGLTWNQPVDQNPTRKSKRPTRVFHTEFSRDNQYSHNFVPSNIAQPPGFNEVNQHRILVEQMPHRELNSQAQVKEQYDDQVFSVTEFADGTIPSIVEERASDQHTLGPNPTFQTWEKLRPPPGGTDYNVHEQITSGPQFARLTMYNVPSNDTLRSDTKLPLGMLLRPLAPFSNKEHESGGVHVADFSNGSSPPRCQRCRTYINPSMRFTEGGSKFICNMCQFSNEVPAEYFQPLDIDHRRIGWEQQPELTFGTYDMIVTSDFWKEEGTEPVPLHHLFLIDVSRNSIKKELPKLAVEAIRTVLYGNEKKYPAKARIGIATYDRAVHFYNLRPTLEQAQMMVMSDIDDPFVPLEIGLFVDPEESRLVIEDLLDKMDVLFEENFAEEPVYGCALDVALQALKKTGGKVSAILSSLPSKGPGAPSLRKWAPQFSGENEHNLFTPDSKHYEELGKNYAMAGVGLDLFLFPSSHCDLANTGIVCQLSGGHEHLYLRFVPHRDGRGFISEFCKTCECELGTEAQLKVRTSPGLQVAAYYGNFFHNGWTEDPHFGTIDSHSTVGILFKYDDKLDPKQDVHFQSALLYTSSDGQRRVRVTNSVATVTEEFRSVANSVDLYATIGIMARDSIYRMREIPLEDIRNRITERLVGVLACYRKQLGPYAAPNQLLMPMCLRGVIALMLAMQKSIPLRNQQLVSDYRIHIGRAMNAFSTDELALLLYPRIVSLHNLLPTHCTYSQSLFVMPANVRASITALEVGGVYLAYDGQKLWLWVDQQVSPALLKDLFGDHVVSLELLDPLMNELPEIDTPVSRQARALIEYFASKSGVRFLGLQLVYEGLPGSSDFQALMVEDPSMNSSGYSGYIMNIHTLVKNKLESNQERSSFKPSFISDTLFTQLGL